MPPSYPVPPATQPAAPSIPYAGDRIQILVDSDRILAHGALPAGSAVLIYTVPEQTVTEVREWWFANSDGVDAHLITIYLCPPGGSPTAADIIIPAFAVAASVYTRLDSRTALETRWTIWGLADVAAKVDYHISGVEIVR